MTKKNIYQTPESDLVTVRFDRNFMDSLTQTQINNREGSEFLMDDGEEVLD